MAKYKIFCPRTKQVKIKFEGNYHSYKHGQNEVEEQPFFSKYPHIFHKIEIVEFTTPKKKTGKGTKIEKLPDFSTEQIFEDPVDPPVDFKIESPTKGWYIVTLNGEQVFPAETGKKCRKAAADEYVVANS